MSGCCYIGTLCDAESLTERRRLPVTDVPNAILYFIELEVKEGVNQGIDNGLARPVR